MSRQATVESSDRATTPGERELTARAGVAAAPDVIGLREAIGNRAFGSLMRRRHLARQVPSKKRNAARPRSVARNDGVPPLTTWAELEAALSDNKVDIKAIVDRIGEERLNELWKAANLLSTLASAMSTERFAYLAAAIMLESRNAPAARKEALRLLSAMLQHKETALRLILRPVTVVIVPRDMQPTELEEFQSLLTKDAGKGPGKTFDGRQFAHVRAFSNVAYGIAVYVAINEENLLGGLPDPKVFDAPKDAKGNVIGSKGEVDDGYPVGFSNTTHEVAHVIHRHGLRDDQKNLVTLAYLAKRAATTGKDGLVKNVWPDGPRVSPVAPQSWKDKGWTDETRLDYLAGLSHDARRKHENYSSQSEGEYFAQLANAYLGANVGNDPTTGRPRNNGRAWIAANEPKEMLDLLDLLFKNVTVNDIETDGTLKPGGKHANPRRPEYVDIWGDVAAPPGPARTAPGSAGGESRKRPGRRRTAISTSRRS